MSKRVDEQDITNTKRKKLKIEKSVGEAKTEIVTTNKHRSNKGNFRRPLPNIRTPPI